MRPADKIWQIRALCIKANSKLWNDHGDVLKRVIAPGIAVPSKIGLSDVLEAVSWNNNKHPSSDALDEDGIHVRREIVDKMIILWDRTSDDLELQSEPCIKYLSEVLLIG